MPARLPRRERTIKVRVCDDQYLALKAKARAAGISVAALLRDHGDQIAIVNRSDWRRRTFQLAAIGNNLNQLARWANGHPADQAHQLVLALLRLERAVRAEDGLDGTQKPDESALP